MSSCLTGKGRAFSAGADIDEMASDNPISLELLNQFADWDRLALIKKPIIGAVKGFVFGGGFELALCCDILISASGTEFSFPEVGLGVMPGAGGTQTVDETCWPYESIGMVMDWGADFRGRRLLSTESLTKSLHLNY